jgi:hypothetical protein
MPAGKSQLDRLRARVEIFISGPPPDDPLYLSNRSWQQKLKVGTLLAAPVLLLGALVAIGATDLFRFHKTDPYEHTSVEAQGPAVPQKRLPEPVLASSDLEVVNIRIAREARQAVVTGVVRNNTNRKVESAVVSYYLADTNGGLVGTDTTGVSNVGPHSSVVFRMPLKIAKAQYVMIREVHAN